MIQPRHEAPFSHRRSQSADCDAKPNGQFLREHNRDLLGVPIDVIDARQALAEIVSWRDTGHHGYVTLLNPHSILECARDRGMRSAVLNSDLALPDGVGITMGARLLGYGHTQRLAGPSFMLNICDWGRMFGLRHFFYGGRENVADTLAHRLGERYPGIRICGTFCPPFREVSPEEDTEFVNRINDASPDLVWVGLGTSKQERWMAAHVGRVRACALLGVGAAFDFHAGTVRWAPAWVRQAGLEWAYRLFQEPRRLWRRNLDSPIFLARIVARRFGIAE